MKKNFVTSMYVFIVWIISSVSLWFTVKTLNLTSTNQFTGKMKSFELELMNSFKATAVVIITLILLKIVLIIKNKNVQDAD